MTDFLTATFLKKKYNVFGHFYSISLSSGKTLDCRSVLEIVRKESSPQNYQDILTQKPNAIFIMMNPGSSKPIDSVNNKINEIDISNLDISLVPTKPDTTQYQVMRIMHNCDWTHVRVLNLSDLRNPNSGDFIKLYKSLEKYDNPYIHSIFSGARQNELDSKLFLGTDIPIICAWGVNSKLDPLIQQCLSKIANHQCIKGILKDKTTDKYFHPLPSLQEQKKLWISNMLVQLSDFR